MSNVMVFGASGPMKNGQLAACLKEAAKRRRMEDIAFFDEEALNVLDRKKMEELCAEQQPKTIINCADHIEVDQAEKEPELAKRLNAESALNVAQVCAKHRILLIHISTAYVFRGNVPKLLHERDYTEPMNMYGHTKLEGERIIATFQPQHIIIRPGWLYSEYGDNFVKTMLQTAAEQEEISVPADQIGSPTYGMDLANAILNMTVDHKMKYGTYHYSNEGVSSLYDFARAIFDISNISVTVMPTISNCYATPVQGPAFSAMDKTKIKNAFGLSVPYWRDALTTCLTNILNKQD